MKADQHNIGRLARELILYHFPNKKITMSQLGGGITNEVFAVTAGREKMVVRISRQPDRINFFMKEQWATSQARPLHIPVPEILEVGNSIIPYPYMISRTIPGTPAIHHPDRLKILFELGKLATRIHRIPTRGYGHMFDWSQNSLSKNNSWPAYLQDELQVNQRLDTLSRHKMIDAQTRKKIIAQLRLISAWKGRTCLQHGDLRLKNVMVDEKGVITAIIDWEECISAVGSAWDLSIALHDLTIDEQESFLEGYGIPAQKLIRETNTLKTFNLLNYAPVIEQLAAQKDKKRLSYYKARLHGALDLFSFR